MAASSDKLGGIVGACLKSSAHRCGVWIRVSKQVRRVSFPASYRQGIRGEQVSWDHGEGHEEGIQPWNHFVFCLGSAECVFMGWHHFRIYRHPRCSMLIPFWKRLTAFWCMFIWICKLPQYQVRKNRNQFQRHATVDQIHGVRRNGIRTRDPRAIV